jgi:hypothetical protein
MQPQSGATPAIPLPAPMPGESSTGASTPDQQDLSNETEEVRKGSHISKTTWGLMLAVAAILDILAILCVLFVVSAWVGWIIEIVGVLIFGLWFLIKSLPLMSPKSLANWVLNLLVGESLTAGAWPGFTFGILLTMGFTKIKDVTGVDVLQIVSTVEGRGSAKKVLSTAAKAETSAVARAGATATGATAAPLAALEEHPVTASERAHYAAANAPVEQGATSNLQVAMNKDRAANNDVQNMQVARSKNREIVNVDAYNLRAAERMNYDSDVDAYNQRVVQRMNYDSDVVAHNRRVAQGKKSNFFEPSQKEDFFHRNRAPLTPFPGAGSADFGRGKLLDFKPRPRTASQETTDEFSTGATPIPKSVNDDVSSDEQMSDNKDQAA